MREKELVEQEVAVRSRDEETLISPHSGFYSEQAGHNLHLFLSCSTPYD